MGALEINGLEGRGEDVAAAAAAGLTPDQRDTVRHGGEIFGMPLHASLIRPLIRRGLFRRVERKGFQVRWQLTPLGLEVQAHIARLQEIAA